MIFVFGKELITIQGFSFKHAESDYVPYKNETVLSLLNRDNGVEIMVQTIKANDFVMLTPSSDESLRESFYILDGNITLEAEKESVTLSKNDFFSFSNISGTVIMKCTVPVTLLYISSKPAYEHVKVFVSNLDELINKVDEKDKYTKRHCQHVMDYSVAICKKMGCGSEILERLAIAALFHDVGKCSIPDEVLQKPGKLTSDERIFIYKHPIHSKEYVEQSFGEEIANIVLCHHERQDGSGYPQGLSGDMIPLEARIIAVADSFDAMTTKRPYNIPRTFEEAADELSACERLYDKRAVEALCSLVSSGEIYHIIQS